MCPSHFVLSQFKCTCFVFIKLHQVLSFKTIGLFSLIKLSPSILLKRKKGQFRLLLKLNLLQRKVSSVHMNTNTHTHQCSLSWSPAILMVLQRFHQQNSFKKNSKDWSKCEHRTNNQHAEIVCGWHFLCMSANIYTHTHAWSVKRKQDFLSLWESGTHTSAWEQQQKNEAHTRAGSQRGIVPMDAEQWQEFWQESCKHAVWSRFKQPL